MIPAETEQDQLEQYLSTDPNPFEKKQQNDAEFDVLGYWMDRRLTWSQLSKLAFDTLAIPLMSDDNERSFSSGRDMITYRRTRLQSDIIQACQCLRSWYGKRKPKRLNMGEIEAPFDNEDAVQKDIDIINAKSNDQGDDMEDY